MDPELTKQLQQLLAALLANAQDAATWAKAELPLLVQEKVAFGRAWNTTILAISVVLGIVVYHAYTRWKLHKFRDDDNKWAACTFGVIAPAFVVGIIFLVSLRWTLLAWFAPRLYILEWLIDMIRYKST
jgi:uncharacterized membrane protein